MLASVVIDAAWLADIQTGSLEVAAKRVEVLRRLDLAGVQLVVDARGAIIRDYEERLAPDSAGRRFVSALVRAGRLAHVEAADLAPDIRVDRTLRTYVAAAARSQATLVTSAPLQEGVLAALQAIGVAVVRPESVLGQLARPAGDAPTVLIVTALQVERDAIVAHLADVREITHRIGTVYWCGTQGTGTTPWTVVVAQVGKYNPRAGIETERALTQFQPQAALLVGVAGGLKDVAIGDVVAAEAVHNYETGRVAVEFSARPQVHKCHYKLVERAKAEIVSGEWINRIIGPPPEPPPKAIVASIASGSVVVAGRNSTTYRSIRRQNSELAVVEMEGHGFLEAAHQWDTPALVIRGVSDLLTRKRQADAAGGQQLASRNASAFAVQLLSKLADPGGLLAR